MKSRLHDAADAELTEAIAYYDEKASGLADRFLAEVKSATRNIETYPEMAPADDEGVRAKVLDRFPYSIMYVVEEYELFIVAIAHHSRRPSYWADRLSRG